MTVTPARFIHALPHPPDLAYRSPTFDLSDLAECGWRDETITLPDGTERINQVPLTEAEFLHPQEGYHLPNSTFHEAVARTIIELLTRRYAQDPSVGVFGNLIIQWPQAEVAAALDDHCPDAFVAFGITDRDRNRTSFNVAQEGVVPRLVFEVVSPRYRKADRVTKVAEYARAGVQEYVILDHRRQRRVILEEVLGYYLWEGQYVPLLPDEEGRIYLSTIDVALGLEDGRVVMIDGQTGERLLLPLELEQLAQAERDRAEQEHARAEQAQAQAAEERARAEEERARADRLEALLRSQGLDPDRVL